MAENSNTSKKSKSVPKSTSKQAANKKVPIKATKSSSSKSSSSKSSSSKSTSSKTKAPEKKFGDTLYDEILILVLLLLSVLVLLSLFTNVMGIFGQAINTLLKGVLGAGAFVLPLLLIVFCLWTIFSGERRFAACKVVGLIIFVVSISTLFQLITSKGTATGEPFIKNMAIFYKNASGINGGVVGGIIAWGLTTAIGWGSYIVTFVAIVISIMLGTGKSLFVGIGSIFGYFGNKRKIKEAKIKAKAEIIREKDEKRENRILLDEEKRMERLEKKGGRRGLLNVILGSATEKGEQAEEENILNKVEKDDIEEIIEPETPRKLIDISGVDLSGKNEKLIEVLGIANESDFAIPIFGISDETANEAENETENEAENEAKIEAEISEEKNRQIPQEEPIGEPIEEAHEEIPVAVKPEAIEENSEAISEAKQEIKSQADAVVKPVMLPTKIAATEKSSTANIAKVPVEEEEYIFPPIDLLGEKPISKSGETKTDMIANAKKLEETLMSFGVEAKVTQINKGPTVTRYELSPSQGVKVSKIVNLADDIALNLAATGIRIEAPIPGKAAVGIEVPNKETQSVYLRSVLESEAFEKFPSKLAFALGEDITGKAIVTDIAKMPHLLIAGATGSGKSVCINTLITSILYKADPKEVKLLLVDPKVVELSVYNGIPHLLIPVVTDPKKAAGALNWAVKEMLGRYESFSESKVRDINGYNSLKKEKNETDLMPQIVIVIDELADLMMAAPGEVEDSICRLAQMARAAGIHLIIATQRPSVDIITGVIKANIPSRLAFAVSSGIDSRTILDGVGAEKLLGKGDMLFYPVGMSKPVRIQGAFVTDKEVENIVEFVKKGKNHSYDQSMVEKITAVSKEADTSDDSDEFFDQALDLIIEKEKASVSMLQRQFRIGYNRAARLMEDMENRGIVSSEDGSKPRKVLITAAQLNEMRYPVNDDIKD